MERDKVGYDLIAQRGAEETHVEVKGVRGTKHVFLMTHGERLQAQADPLFQLCVVTRALEPQRQLCWWRGGEVEGAFGFRPIAYQARRR